MKDIFINIFWTAIACLVIVSALIVLPLFLMIFFVAILGGLVYALIADYRKKD